MNIIRQIVSGLVTGIVLVGIIIGAWCGYLALEHYWKDQAAAKLKHLKPEVDKYVKIVSRSGQKPDSTLRATGRVAIICMATNLNDRTPLSRSSECIDPLMLKLPGNLFPDSPDQVQTIVAAYWGEIYLTRYVDPSDNAKVIAGAYKETCKIEVFDRATGKLIARSKFEGSSPPKETLVNAKRSGLTSIFGPPPDDAIIDYLAHLID